MKRQDTRRTNPGNEHRQKFGIRPSPATRCKQSTFGMSQLTQRKGRPIKEQGTPSHSAWNRLCSLTQSHRVKEEDRTSTLPGQTHRRRCYWQGKAPLCLRPSDDDFRSTTRLAKSILTSASCRRIFSKTTNVSNFGCLSPWIQCEHLHLFSIPSSVPNKARRDVMDKRVSNISVRSSWSGSEMLKSTATVRFTL